MNTRHLAALLGFAFVAASAMRCCAWSAPAPSMPSPPCSKATSISASFSHA